MFSKKRKKKLRKRKNRKRKEQIEASGRACVFNAGLLARSQFASGRSIDQPAQSRLSVVFLGTEQMLSWYPNSTLNCMLLMQPSQW
jgi:hypothetical protein